MAEPAADPGDPRVAAVLDRAIAAYRDLGALGETVADEWQYVTDLLAVHGADLAAIRAAGGDRRLSPAAVRAIDLLIEEVGLIVDPHRAIDWLSTFPQVVRLAVASAPAVAGA